MCDGPRGLEGDMAGVDDWVGVFSTNWRLQQGSSSWCATRASHPLGAGKPCRWLGACGSCQCKVILCKVLICWLCLCALFCSRPCHLQLHINESSYLQLVELQESMSYPGLLTQVWAGKQRTLYHVVPYIT